MTGFGLFRSIFVLQLRVWLSSSVIVMCKLLQNLRNGSGCTGSGLGDALMCLMLPTASSIDLRNVFLVLVLVGIGMCFRRETAYKLYMPQQL